MYDCATQVSNEIYNMSDLDECIGCETGCDYDGSHRDEYGNYHPACASRAAQLDRLSKSSHEIPTDYNYGKFELRSDSSNKEYTISDNHEIPEKEKFEPLNLCGAGSLSLKYIKQPESYDDEGFPIYSNKIITPEIVHQRYILHNKVLEYIATYHDEKYAQLWLDEFACCNCCQQHNNRKPVTWGPWKQWRIPKSKTSDKINPCLCDCRHVARAICNIYPTTIQ